MNDSQKMRNRKCVEAVQDNGLDRLRGRFRELETGFERFFDNYELCLKRCGI